MTLAMPWPQSESRVRERVRALVESVHHPGELTAVRLDWRTPQAHHWDLPGAAWIALRLTVSAIDDEVYQREIWGPDWPCDWEKALQQLASDLEDWVCETSFGWGQRRAAVVPVDE